MRWPRTGTLLYEWQPCDDLNALLSIVGVLYVLLPRTLEGTGINEKTDMLGLATNAQRTHDGLADSDSAGPRDTCTYVPFGPRKNFVNLVNRPKRKIYLCPEMMAGVQIIFHLLIRPKRS